MMSRRITLTIAAVLTVIIIGIIVFAATSSATPVAVSQPTTSLSV